MSHVRTQIRASIAALVTGLASTGPRVFQSRMRPQSDAILPCLLVTTADEEITQSQIGGLFERRLSLIIIGIAKQNNAIDDALDQIAAEVETQMVIDHRATLVGIETDFDDETDKPVGRIALRYQIIYYTRAGTPGTPA